ncbi:MAG: hypothetical protein WDN08_22090 [Rhizomicrobium sp.]
MRQRVCVRDFGDDATANWRFSDGYAADYAYDALNRPTAVTEHTGGAALAAYAYDPLSRRTGVTYNGGNGLSGGASAMAYTYSNAGDLLALTDDLAGTSNDVTSLRGVVQCRLGAGAPPKSKTIRCSRQAQRPTTSATAPGSAAPEPPFLQPTFPFKASTRQGLRALRL